MEENMFVIIGVVIIVAIWVALQLVNANDSINRAITMVQMPDEWHAHKEKRENTSIATSVAYSPTQKPQLQHQSER
jgi:hypothetical protein